MWGVFPLVVSGGKLIELISQWPLLIRYAWCIECCNLCCHTLCRISRQTNKTFRISQYLNQASRNSTFCLVLWESWEGAALWSLCRLRSPSLELSWVNACLQRMVSCHFFKFLERRPSMCGAWVWSGQDSALDWAGSWWLSSTCLRSVVGKGKERDVLVTAVLVMKGRCISYFWRAKKRRYLCFLCLSLFMSRRTQSSTGCCYDVLASLPGVALAPAAWGRGCIRAVLWCCWWGWAEKSKALSVRDRSSSPMCCVSIEAPSVLSWSRRRTELEGVLFLANITYTWGEISLEKFRV